jgi:hypothetical protein
MATDTNNPTPTRRAMLAGIAALPAIGIMGQAIAAPTMDSADWDLLFADFQAATKAWQDYDRVIFLPAHHRKQAGGRKVPDAIGQRMDDLVNEANRIEVQLLMTPAPNNTALHWKLERALDGDGEWCDGVLSCMRADAARLLIGRA